MSLKKMGYSDIAVDVIIQGLNLRKMDNPGYFWKSESDCGDVLFLYMQIQNGVILDASFQYLGCLGLQLAASVLTELIKNKSIEALSQFSVRDIISYTKAIPMQKMECVEFAVESFQSFLKNLPQARVH